MQIVTEEMKAIWLSRAREILKPKCNNLKIKNIQSFYEENGVVYSNNFTAVAFQCDGKGQYINVDFL